jgi:hypothetical protein
VLQRQVTGTYTAQTGSGRFHDTMPYTDGAFNVTVTPSGGFRAMSSPPKVPTVGEAWVMLAPDSGSGARRPKTLPETTTEPEFVAAGELLGSSPPKAPAPDTNPQGKGEDQTMDSGPQGGPGP